ncbi:MarR family winged helix-turn-helix transcriptional regulator [Pendulispora albinea]|uniref:MarR family transcriptional regulator n=1 Tax=Pendulispora albinea TaxID=2741071 RepID=A0ABZ2MC64_9BACT
MSLDRDVEELNAALHVLLLRLNLARLDLWSDKLVGISFLDLHALSFAEEKPDHTLAEMREFLQVPQSTLTSIIDRLEKRELLMRTIHPTDKRSYRIALTERGLDVQREHHRVERMLMRKILDALPDPDDRAAFLKLFRKIARKV